MDSRTLIMEATIDEFKRTGHKFTMDHIAKRLSMSKKTLYTLFQDKETLFFETVDYYFDAVKESELQIMEDCTLNIVDKIHRLLVLLPERYQNMDWHQIYSGKEKYPRIYAHFKKRLDKAWETIIALLEEGMNQGKIKRFSIPVLKAMVEASVEHFLSSEPFIQEKIPYETALNEMASIIMNGILA